MYRINTVKNMIIDNIILETLEHYLDDVPDNTLLIIKDKIIEDMVNLPIDVLINDLYDL